MTTETPEIVEPTETPVSKKSVETEPDTYHNPNALFRIAIWSGWISWAFLVIALANFAFRIYGNVVPLIQSGQYDFQTLLYYTINELYSLLFMAFVVLVLQGVSQGLFALLDLLDKKQEE